MLVLDQHYPARHWVNLLCSLQPRLLFVNNRNPFMRTQALPTLFAAGLAAAAFTASSQALAYGGGDFFTRFGVAKVSPKSDNGSLAGGALAVDVEDDTRFAFTLGYRFHDKLGVELLAAEPFKHDIKLGGENLASTKHQIGRAHV